MCKNRSYSQTCSNNHIWKTTTGLRRLIVGLPKQIPIQLWQYKMTNCLMQPATTYFVPQMEKTCLKQPLQNFILLKFLVPFLDNIRCCTNFLDTPQAFTQHLPNHIKHFVSLFLSCIFYFVKLKRKTCHRKK